MNATTDYSTSTLNQLFKKQQSTIFWLSLLAFCLVTLVGLGRTSVDVLSYGLWFYFSLYVLRRFSSKAFTVYVIITFIITAVYLPTALMYGKMDIAIIASLFETNWQESQEFFGLIGAKSYLSLLFYLLTLLLVLKLNGKVLIPKVKTKKLYILVGILVIAIFEKPITDSVKEKSFKVEHLNQITYYPLRHVLAINYKTRNYLANRKQIRDAQAMMPTWNFEKVTQNYDTYVLVVGESMRRDYMSVYGYPLETTPFLQQAKGVFFDNFISAGPNTRLSLQRMLFQTSNFEDINYAHTPVSLANSLDMDTYWLSNQGVYGDYDVLASAVGARANEAYYLKTGKMSVDNQSDLELLPKFDEIISKQASTQKKLIVLHLMGSHSDFCNRIDSNYGINNITDYASKDLSCYLSSYRQTDKLLEKIYNKLQVSKQPFSLMYFADHGLAHKKRDSAKLTLFHGTTFKEDYEVPLLVLSSDAEQQTRITAQRSGYNFMSAVAEWLGAEETGLKLATPFFADVATDKKIKVFNGNDVIDYDSLADDPVITE